MHTRAFSMISTGFWEGRDPPRDADAIGTTKGAGQARGRDRHVTLPADAIGGV